MLQALVETSLRYKFLVLIALESWLFWWLARGCNCAD